MWMLRVEWKNSAGEYRPAGVYFSLLALSLIVVLCSYYFLDAFIIIIIVAFYTLLLRWCINMVFIFVKVL